MKVSIHNETFGLHSITFNPHVYVSAHHTTTLILDDAEYEALEKAMDEEQALMAGDFEQESRQDVRETEAWLDGAPSYGGSV